MEKQTRSSLQNLSISYEFALAIGNSLNLTEMLHEVIHKIVHKTNAFRGIIWVNNKGKELQPVASAGINIDDVLTQGKLMDLQDVFNQILKREQFVLRHKDDNDFLQYCPLLTKREESVLIVPVINVAILYLVYSNRQTADEYLADLLIGLSKKLGIAIEACTAHNNIVNEVQVRMEAEEELKRKTEQLSSGEKELKRFYGESEQARKSLLSILEDVQRKEEAIQKSEEKYRLLADNSIDAIWQMDLKLVFTYISPSIKDVMGYTVEEWVGTRLSQHASTKEFFNMARKALYAIKHYKELKHLTFNTVMLHKDGTEIPVEITAKFLFNKKGLPIGLQGTTRNVTKRKKAEEVLKESEQRFRSYFEMSLIGMAITSVEKGWIDANDKLCEILGYSLDELKQKTWVEMTHQDDLEADLEKFNQILENKINSYSLEKRFFRKNGSLVFTKISIGCVRNSDGSINYIICLIEDITDNKINELVIKRSEERWQFALEGSGDGVWDWSVQLNEVFFSKQWKAMLGFKEDEISGNMEEWDKRIHPDDIETVHEDIQKHIDGKTPVYENEHRVQCKDGSYKWIYSRGKVISWTDEEKPLRMIGTHSDITGRKLAELELAKHRDKLKELVNERTYEVEKSQKSLVLLMEDVNEVNLELKSVNTILDATNKELEAFSYSVSHDLRAPLTRMDGFSKALIDSYSSNLDDKAVHFLNRIRASSQHMARLIDDLLSLSRITREKVTRQKVDLSQTAVNIANELNASEPGREVDFKITKELSVNADRKFVIIILENLLGNAFKFTGKKKNAIIEFGKKIIDEDEVFYIKDNGAGFNMKYYDKIFTAFQRLHSDEEFKGSGIGLAIVQRIINKHGGKIWAESEEGKGATFYFRFE